MVHDQIWSSLLEAGAANPDSLGRRLLPLLDGSELLGHYRTMPYATRLTASLTTVLTPREHARLELAILRTHDPLNPNGARSQELIDTLLGQLDPGRVQDPAVRRRLAELDSQGGPPPAPQPPAMSGGSGSYGVRERLRERGALGGTDEALLQAMERVQSDIVHTTSGATDDHHAVRERLRESVPALYSILIPAGPAIDQPAYDEAFMLLVHGAERLASDPEALPCTGLGQMVFGILRAALPTDDPSGEGS
jgi:hypothetical protein